MLYFIFEITQMLNKLFVVILFLVSNFFSIAQLHQITFQVDMTNEVI